MREEFLWVEKYRPRNISDCVLPSETKKIFLDFVNNKEIPNLLLCGTAGVGKTTVARALCNELGADWILINGSEERNIDTLRVKIKQFASTVSLTVDGGPKIVILDEADYLNPQSTQPALRGFIEEFSKNCRFIFTCNYKNRIIQPLHSRCSVIDFTIEANQKPMIASQIFQRILQILTDENVDYNDKVVVEVINKFFPDFRRMLNEIQKYSASGKIDSGILASLDDESLNELLNFIKEKEFSKMRKWVAMNIHNDPQNLYRKIYDSFFTKFENTSVPQAIIILSDYTYKSAFVADQEVNMVACLTELMMECKIK
jgi:DNA polymerase III delta prime subunit|tara:strand:+ start:434 stop:1378 length:945 start_codon:yes stop_codon:yes gene_type:complete